jgi:hypothetical protein
MTRAQTSGISLTADDAAIVKGMIKRGDRQHDIAAWFGVNGGRIGEIAGGDKFAGVKPAAASVLPPPGPYITGREAHAAVSGLEQIRTILQSAANECERVLAEIEGKRS